MSEQKNVVYSGHACATPGRGKDTNVLTAQTIINFHTVPEACFALSCACGKDWKGAVGVLERSVRMERIAEPWKAWFLLAKSRPKL